MMRVTVTVNKDTASPAAQRLRRTMQPHELATVVSRSGAACYVSNFEALAAERHRSGVSSVAHNFYLDAARMTNGTHSGSTAFITVDGPAGLRQRLEGGLIQAVNYPYLFIPLKGTPAEGRTAGDFAGQLVVIWNQMMERGVAKEKGKDGLVLFALRKSVVQNADSAVVPSDDALREAFRTAIAKALQRAWKKDQEAASEES